MRKIVLGLAVTLDGFIEGPMGEYDWCLTDDDYGMNEFMQSIDAVFYGRKSYDLMLKYESEGGGNPFSSIHSFVFSTNPKQNTSKVTWISGDIHSQVRALKNQPGKDIWLFGGASLTTEFINHGLVDRLWLSVHPLLLGSGKLLFNDIKSRVPLKLIDTKAYPSGLVSLKYDVVNSDTVLK